MSGHLTVENIFTAYDRADVLSGISIDVQPGKITCILGSNGAGKSTLIRSILRLTPPRAGSIAFEGKTLDQMATHEIVGLGIACIPEGRRIFARMTVEENLRVGAYLVNAEKTVKARLDKVYEVFPRLKERAKQLAGTMSGGEQAMVSIGRGMMTDPKLLIIDEPSLGLSPLFVQANFNIVRRLNETGVTILLVEQNVNQTLAIAHYGYVLSQGKIIVQGDSEMLAKNEEVHSAYFGGAH